MANEKDYFARNIDSEKKYKNHLEKEKRRKKLRSVNKKFKRNQKPKRRRRDWGADIEAWETYDGYEDGYETEERVMPRSESERRRRIEKEILREAGVEAELDETARSPETGLPGLVLTVNKGLCQVEVGERTLSCHIRGTLKATETAYSNVVAAGDDVLISEDGTGGGVIEAVLPRRSVLARADVSNNHRRQVIVANADQLLIVSAWREPLLWLELIDRYLIAAERNNLPPLICLNKADLIEDEAECRATLQPYRDLGYPVLVTSVLTGAGLEALETVLRGKLTVLSGLSGVGKSSLLRAVQPTLTLRTAAVSDSSGEGRHTTTQASLLRLDDQTGVIDTPGIREFSLSGLRQRELALFFPEIRHRAAACRFADCTHLTEPECGVRAAVEAGHIAASRYHSYRQIYGTLPA